MLSHLSFASLPVLDIDRALAFWRDVMGLRVTVDAPYGPTRWVMLQIPGARTQIHLDPVATLPETGKPALPIIAPDVVAAVETLRGHGVEIVAEPRAAEWDADTTYALVRDSEGNVILLASR